MLTPSLSYTLDPSYNIILVDDGWDMFALDNDAPNLTQNNVLGKSLWDYVDNLTLNHLLKSLFDRVRMDSSMNRIPFRCDSPILCRFMHFEMIPLPDRFLKIQTFIERIETRPYESIMDRTIPHSDEFVLMCSWCNKIQTDDLWYDLEIGIKKLKLFDLLKPPFISHGICPGCQDKLLNS